MRPRKYFCATMFVAVCDQNFGNSTPFGAENQKHVAGDVGVARLPLDLGEGIAVGNREEAPHSGTCRLVNDCVPEVLAVDSRAWASLADAPSPTSWSKLFVERPVGGADRRRADLSG